MVKPVVHLQQHARLSIRLFGRFCVQRDTEQVESLDGKAQTLLSYLLLNRHRTHTRESLADLLWESSGSQSRKYLRQVLWQLHNALEGPDGLSDERLILVETDWVRINLGAHYWLDVAAFEQASAAAHENRG